MNLHQPRVFCSVVKYRSYTRAAEALFMTQPAVSLQIQALEKSLQVKLLERVKGKLIVTEAGQALYQCALPMLNAEEEAKRVSRTRRLIEQTLRERGYTLADASQSARD